LERHSLRLDRGRPVGLTITGRFWSEPLLNRVARRCSVAWRRTATLAQRRGNVPSLATVNQMRKEWQMPEDRMAALVTPTRE